MLGPSQPLVALRRALSRLVRLSDDSHLGDRQGGRLGERPPQAERHVVRLAEVATCSQPELPHSCDEVGIHTPTNRILTDIVTKVERGELKPDPKHITDLRLN